jgi:4-carboxymuconolactone decarboxylase
MDKALYDKGLQVRREVLGAEYVDPQLAQTDGFTGTIQDLVTEYCWGAAWTRPGLDRRQRSMLNLAILIALNRGTEFKTHVRGALANGLTTDDILEVIVQCMIYCGVPAAVEGARLAKEVFREKGIQPR